MHDCPDCGYACDCDCDDLWRDRYEDCACECSSDDCEVPDEGDYADCDDDCDEDAVDLDPGECPRCGAHNRHDRCCCDG